MRIFSGIQPTGRKHLGNYIGAIKPWVTAQDRGEAIYCVVDLHATSVPYQPAALRESVYDTAATLLAAGLDPEDVATHLQGDFARGRRRRTGAHGALARAARSYQLRANVSPSVGGRPGATTRSSATTPPSP